MSLRGQRPQVRFACQCGSNGEQIYFTGTSQCSDPITFQMPGGGMLGGLGMRGGMMTCVALKKWSGWQ